MSNNNWGRNLKKVQGKPSRDDSWSCTNVGLQAKPSKDWKWISHVLKSLKDIFDFILYNLKITNSTIKTII